MVLHLLLALVVVIIAARVTALAVGRLHQPPVIGEMVAGILLGPSLLGAVAPQVSAFVFPASLMPVLGALAQLGIIIYMFLVGVKLDLAVVRERIAASIAVSQTSIVVPFLCGGALSLWLYADYSSRDVPLAVFALFMGVAMSITAFPVLARILADRGLETTPLGTIALACAAVGDVMAWCLLALVIGAARASIGDSLITIGLAIVFTLAVLRFGNRAIARLAAWREARGKPSQTSFMVMCVALLAAALATEWIGVHALFGAFLLGVLVPPSSALARDLVDRLEDATVVLLLPLFFAFTGMRTQIGLIHGAGDVIACAAIIAIASVAKIGGGTVAALVTGMDRRQALSLGVLMNTRGLMELIVLNIGLEIGVLSPALFTMLVIMALVTTFATTPILDWLRK